MADSFFILFFSPHLPLPLPKSIRQWLGELRLQNYKKIYTFQYLYGKDRNPQLPTHQPSRTISSNESYWATTMGVRFICISINSTLLLGMAHTTYL